MTLRPLRSLKKLIMIYQQLIWFPLKVVYFSHLPLRAKHFDDKIKAYLTEHPHASIVNIGAGLDTTFYRVDNADLFTGTISIFRTSLKSENR